MSSWSCAQNCYQRISELEGVLGAAERTAEQLHLLKAELEAKDKVRLLPRVL